MCYGSGCKWEIRYGEDAGECKKPSQFPCPMDEDSYDNEDNYPDREEEESNYYGR